MRPNKRESRKGPKMAEKPNKGPEPSKHGVPPPKAKTSMKGDP